MSRQEANHQLSGQLEEMEHAEQQGAGTGDALALIALLQDYAALQEQHTALQVSQPYLSSVTSARSCIYQVVQSNPWIAEAKNVTDSSRQGHFVQMFV